MSNENGNGNHRNGTNNNGHQRNGQVNGSVSPNPPREWGLKVS